MNARFVLILVLTGLVFFSRECWVLAAQDLRVRPVRLAAFEEAPFPAADAIARLRDAVEPDLGRADVLVLLGERFEETCRSTAAEAAGRRSAAVLYERAATAFPAWARGQYRLATVLLGEGDEKAALRHLRAAARSAGNHPALLEKIGDLHLTVFRLAGDPESLLRAVDLYRDAAEREPGRLPGIYDSLEGCLADPTGLRTVTPDTPDALAVLARRLADRGHFRDALALLDSLPPDRGAAADVLRLRGEALLRLDRLDAGLAAFAKLVRTAAEPADAIRDVERRIRGVPPERRAAFFGDLVDTGPAARLARARALREAGDGTGAMAEIDGILEGCRDGGIARSDRDLEAACYELRVAEWTARKQPIQAAADATAAARLLPTVARWRRAGMLWAAAGDARRTREAFERALREVPDRDAENRADLEKEMVDAMTRAARTAGDGR